MFFSFICKFPLFPILKHKINLFPDEHETNNEYCDNLSSQILVSVLTDVSVKPVRFRYRISDDDNQLSKRNLNTVRNKEQLSNGLNKRKGKI